MNTLAYILYLAFTFLITVRVGWHFYRNGRTFIYHLLHQDASLTDAVNRILLTGYYLLNLGYATLMISTWKTVTGWLDLCTSVAVMTSRIALTLAVVHYCNMTVIYLVSRSKKFTHL